MMRKSTRSSISVFLLILWSVSVAAAPDMFSGVVEHARYVGALGLKGEVFHVQGFALDGPHLWITSVDLARRRAYLHEFDRGTGRFVRRVELTDGVRYHPGGLSLSGRSIFVPVAEPRPHSSAVLVEIDADSLTVRRRIAVADHLGCVAASGQVLVAGNWDSALLYVFDQRTGTRLRIVPNRLPTQYQDMKFVGNQLVAGGTLTLWNGSVDWIDWPSMHLRRSVHAGAIGPLRPFGRGGPSTGEGMAIEGRDLYLLPEDGPSRVFHFRLDDRRLDNVPPRA